ncbi:uncharacterized protein [Embiotoca jacksoni]|uniref:uncharacterized protein isoform X1 n=1 Tax=Embiotoca jacksoni TaxID=100190 RepID=UPI0037042FFA
MAENAVFKVALPASPTAACSTREAERRKTDPLKRKARRESDSKRNETCVNIGEASRRWRETRERVGLELDSELAALLLDSYEKVTSPQTVRRSDSATSSCSAASVSARDENLSVADVGDANNNNDAKDASPRQPSASVMSRDLSDDIIDVDEFNDLRNSTIDWAEDGWCRAEEAESVLCPEETGDDDHSHPVCVRTGGALHHSVSLETLPSISVEETVFDSSDVDPPRRSERLRAPSDGDVVDEPASVAYHQNLKLLAEFLLLPVPACTFAECRAPGPFQVTVGSSGTAAIIEWACPLGHTVWRWSSQPSLRCGMLLGDFMLAMNIVLSGNDYSKVALLFRFMNTGMVGRSAFSSVQEACCVDAIRRLWEEKRGAIVSRLRPKASVEVLGGGRTDGFRESCTYSLMERDSKQVVSMVTVDKRETAQNGIAMETEAFIRTFDALREEMKNLSEICTDARGRISSLFTSGIYKSCGVRHSLDMRDGLRELGKKIHEAGQRDGCSVLLRWNKDVCNHFWFCAKVAKSYEDFIDTWAGVLHHVTGEREWALGACRHDDGDEELMETGSAAHRVLTEIVLDPRWLRRVQKRLGFRSTAELESFHNHVLMYAGERFSFTPPVYSARTLLAGLDYNHHVHRPERRRADGSVEYRKLFNRKSQRWILYAVKVDKDYGYIPDLQRAVLRSRSAAHGDEPTQCGGPCVSRGEVLPPDVQQLVVIKEEVPHEWSPSLDQQDPELLHIKEEEEELRSSQEEEQLHGPEEDITRFPFTAVPVKSEDDEEKPQSSHLHQRQTEDDGETTVKTESDGEDCGGPEPARNTHPNSPLLTHTEGKVFETDVSVDDDDDDDDEDLQEPLSDCASETEDSDDGWKESGTPESDVGCSSVQKTFSCSECGKLFIYKRSLQIHTTRHSGKCSASCLDNKKSVDCQMRVPTGKKPLECDVCRQTFKQHRNLREHERIHTGERPFSCEVCGKRFRQHRNVKTHMGIHTAVRLFGCDVCGRRFKQQRNLKEHMIVHTGEKPYGCDDCGQRFTRQDSLNTHTRIHTGEKPFSCEQCGKKFNRRGSLRRHKSLHTGEKPFSCDFCGKQFTQEGCLKKHKRVHTGEKPFSCDVCGKKFTQDVSLKKHKIVHTGEKPFGCDFCGKQFTQAGSLQKHKKKHTGTKPFGVMRKSEKT